MKPLTVTVGVGGVGAVAAGRNRRTAARLPSPEQRRRPRRRSHTPHRAASVDDELAYLPPDARTCFLGSANARSGLAIATESSIVCMSPRSTGSSPLVLSTVRIVACGMSSHIGLPVQSFPGRHSLAR